MYCMTNNYVLLLKLYKSDLNFGKRSFPKKTPKLAWGERIITRMKQDRITRHQVTYVKRL